MPSEAAFKMIWGKVKGDIKKPTLSTKVYKDECVYSLDDPFSPTGLYINLKTMAGVSERYLQKDASRSGNSLYLQLKFKRIAVDMEEKKDKLAIGEEKNNL
jgi:ubiquitin carboxyl-terminal hydrolase 5/13